LLERDRQPPREIRKRFPFPIDGMLLAKIAKPIELVFLLP
jgi:hypothetical protein